MVKIKVLLENTKINNNLKKKHGLSLYIEYGNHTILLDVGPDGKFLFNSKVMSIDVSSIETLILSHNHIDHTGGLDVFCRENSHANIYMFGDKNDQYYAKVAGIFKYSIGLKCSDESKKRIVSLDRDFQINAHANFIRNRVNTYHKPSLNKSLYRQTHGIMEQDPFLHEGILVIEDHNELVLFNSCSHNGVVNSVETVKEVFPDKKVRAYAGGFHLSNSMSKQNEEDSALNEFAAYFLNKDIQLYTGHCTGKYPFNYLKKRLGDKIDQIHTGMELEV